MAPKEKGMGGSGKTSSVRPCGCVLGGSKADEDVVTRNLGCFFAILKSRADHVT